MTKLRAPGGCPWDIEQTHKSLRTQLVEEVAELLETIDRSDKEHMKEELGDVLLQIVFHSNLAEEAGAFTFDDVAREVNEKLIRRHPHVFGDSDASDTEAVLRQWEEIKATEKKNGPQSTGRFKNLPPALPALAYALEVDKQIYKKGYQHEDLPDAEGVESLAEDLTEETAGELLYQVASACRHAGIDPETALRAFTGKLVVNIENAEPRDSIL